jgi:hypothetical protein
MTSPMLKPWYLEFGVPKYLRPFSVALDAAFRGHVTHRLALGF